MLELVFVVLLLVDVHWKLFVLVNSKFFLELIKKTNVSFTDHDDDLLEVVKQNIELNDGACKKECIQIQKFDWKQFNTNEIDNQIEIILAADGILLFF